jgi:hypothetical protein
MGTSRAALRRVTAVATATGPVKPFRQTRTDRALRIPRWLALATGAALSVGPILAVSSRGASPRVRLLRGVLGSSAAAYVLTVVLDAAEHLRLEKAVTGHYLRWQAVPLGESLLHTGILADVALAAASVRHPRRLLRPRDRAMLLAPAAFLAVGWLDEIVYHRRRVGLREEVIHALEHISEGMMWTALYALRFVTKR